MNGRLRVLVRVVGFVGLVHISLGLLLGPLGWWASWRLTPSALENPEVCRAIEEAVKEMPEASRAGGGQPDMAELSRIVTSRSFRLLVSGMALLGLAFNGSIAWLCWGFARGSLEGLRPFLILMAGFALYMYGLPRLPVPESQLGLTVGAAWGVGNMGLAAFFFTYYWLWGPMLAVAGTRGSSKP